MQRIYGIEGILAKVAFDKPSMSVVHEDNCTLSNKRTQEYEVFRHKQDVEYISDFDKEIKRLKGEK
ncbi:hypothetical protein [Prevotella pallens]|uniref:hypothetical protein n=1 Tax=Prevotella pallens TaxID=60133 RepID=UPI0028E1AB26|nr:hypothetical protein [Prevotella pallens]